MQAWWELRAIGLTRTRSRTQPAHHWVATSALGPAETAVASAAAAAVRAVVGPDLGRAEWQRSRAEQTPHSRLQWSSAALVLSQQQHRVPG